MICRICDKQNLELVIDLGSQPWGNNFLPKEKIGTESFYPLRVMYCLSCKTAQLDFTVKKEIMFSNHTYLSGVTSSLSAHFKKIAYEVDTQFFSEVKNKSVLDIGSNDGTQLKYFKDLDYEVLGIESSMLISKIANEQGIHTLNAFFNEETMKNIGRQFDVFNASGVFFHLEELHSVCRGIKMGLKKDGIFVVQFLYMKSIIKNMAFDQIYHEHLLYYTLQTIQVLLNRHNLKMFHAYLSPIHGGSIIGYICHSESSRVKSKELKELEALEVKNGCNEITAYFSFAKKIKQMKDTNLDFLVAAKKKGKLVYGFGAPVKGNTLLNYFGIGPDLIKYLIERNTLRRGLYSPGMHIPLLMEDEITEFPSIYYVLAWNFKDEILARNQNLVQQGVEFYFPVNP